MIKNLTAVFLTTALIASCACGKGADGKRGAINLGRQPAAIVLAATNNDVSLSVGHGGIGSVARLTPLSGGSTITGFDTSQMDDGDMVMLRNEGTADAITLTNADSGSVARNRMLLPSAQNVVLAPKTSMWIEYDATAVSLVAGPGLPNAPTFAGAVTMTGTVTTTSGSITTGQETVTSGACSLTKKTLVSATGTVAYTLADGTVTGQVKQFEVTVAASTPLGTLTITTPAGSESATHVFTAVGQQLVLQWNGTGWHVIGKTRAGSQAVVVGTTVLTGYDMASTYALSVTATVHSLTTMGIPNGLVGGEIIHLTTPTAASTPLGDIAITAITIATGAAATSYAGINATTAQATFIWNGAAWQNTALTTATVSMIDTIFSTLLASNDNVSRKRIAA